MGQDQHTLETQECGLDTHRSSIAPSTTTRTRNSIGIVLALFSLYVIWGSTYLGMRIAEESFPPFIMSGIRFLMAGSILYAILRLRKIPSPTPAQWKGSAIVGLLLIVGGNGGVAFAEQWVASGIAAVMLAATPLWAALWFGLLGRWPDRSEWVGLALGFAGVILLNLEHGLWANPLGAITLLLSPMCWALGSALSTRVSLPSGLMASAAQMLIGGAALLILALLLGERMHGLPGERSILAMLYLIVFGALVAYSSYGYLLRRVRPAVATSYAYVNPAVAVILGMLLANEQITLVGIGAMFVILTGVALVTLRRKH